VTIEPAKATVDSRGVGFIGLQEHLIREERHGAAADLID
jgi:hypothetical protein